MERSSFYRAVTAGMVTALATAGVVAAAISPAQAAGPCTTTCYVDATLGNDANSGQQTSPLRTIQAGIDAVSPGGTVDVRPGNYSETAAARTPASIGGTYDFGLFIGTGKTGITVQGVTAADVAIASAASVAAHVTTNSTASFGPVGVFVEGDNVTIQGLAFGANLTDATGCVTPGTCRQGRTIESVGQNVSLSRNVIEDVYGSVLLSDPRYDTLLDTPYVTTYSITNNVFRHGVSLDVASGPGGGPNGGPTSGRVITGNTFDGDSNPAACPVSAACTVNQITKPALAFDGAGTAVPAFAAPVGPATVSGNTFGASPENIAHRYGPGDTSAAFPWAGYFSGNTFGRAAVDTTDGNAANIRSISYGDFPIVDRIGGTLQTTHPTGCVGSDCTGEIDNAQTGDVVLVRGTFGEQVTIANDLTLRGGVGGTLTGSGSGTGVSITGPGTVTVDNLAINHYATGIGISGGVAFITLDTVTANGVGVAVTGGDAHVNLNAVSANTSFAMTSSVPAADAHCNWWGSVFGPGASVDANVDYLPYWLVSATLTQANCRPVMSLGTSTVSVVEGSTGQHTIVQLPVTLTAPWPTGVTAHWTTVNGTATSADSDYTAASGTVAFAANSTSPQTISVTVNGDVKVEDYQSFTVALSAPVDNGIGTGTQTILIKNDDRPKLAAIPLTRPFLEGTTPKFQVRLLQRYYLPITITASTTDGSAQAPGDYTALSGYTVIIPAGSFGPAPVPVTIKRDHTVETSEDFYVTATSGSVINTVTAIGTIASNKT